MTEHMDHHLQGDTEQAKFSAAKIYFGTPDAVTEVDKVSKDKMAEFEAEFADESEREFEDPTAAQLLAERHPTWPPIQLRIHFSAHGTPEDQRGVPESMQDPKTRPDIYLYEGLGGSLEDIAAWQEVADDNDWSVEAALRANPEIVGSVDETQMKGLLGSKIAVGSIDLRAANVDDAELDSAIDRAFNFYLHKDFEESLQSVDQAAKTRVELHGRREAVMIQRLEPEIARLIKQRPGLGTKDKLNIFLTLGSMHTTLFRDFKQAGFEVDRTFSETPYLYSYMDELERTYQFGAETRLNVDRKNKLLARAYLEGSFMGEELKAESDNDVTLVKCYIGEQFGYDEIKAMHGELMQSQKPPTDILAEHLKAKGFDDLPKDPAEVHELAIQLRAGLHRQAGLKKDEPSSADIKTGLE